MKKHLLSAAAILCAMSATAARNSDPVLMNVAGKNVSLSEFQSVSYTHLTLPTIA